MKKAVYLEPRTLLKYDGAHIIGYLNEKVIEDYVPEVPEGEDTPEPCTAYEYEGTENDGGTVMKCDDVNDRDKVISAIIHTRYSIDDEIAINRHMLEDAERYAQEWTEYNAFCNEAKATAIRWFN